jgi:AraC-like DNA-binding protein
MIINPTFRYQKKSSAPTILHVRSCGHYWIPEDKWHDKVMTKSFLQLFWGIRGTASIKYNNKEVLLKPNTVCFYLPGDKHEVSLKESPLEYCWLTIDGDNLKDIIDTFKITRKILNSGPCPVELFESLNIKLHDYTQRGEYLASAEGYQILCLAFAGQSRENTLTEQFKLIVNKNISNQNLQLSFIADKLKIHPTTLTRNIQNTLGMTPIEYITTLRMQHVLSMIRTSRYNFKEIALASGFANANYLAKVFRKKFGCSPTEFRKNGEFID